MQYSLLCARVFFSFLIIFLQCTWGKWQKYRGCVCLGIYENMFVLLREFTSVGG